MRRVRGSVLLVVGVVIVCMCGPSAEAMAALVSRAPVVAASCPGGGEQSITRVTSTSARNGALAPPGTVWTTVCRGDHQAVFKGGPMNSALNTARHVPNQICPFDYVLPALVILRYRAVTLHFIVEMGGCPGVRLRDGNELSFTTAALKLLQGRLRSALF